MSKVRKIAVFFYLIPIAHVGLAQQHNIARIWNEAVLMAIRNDFARPPVQARNLYHISLAMYEAYAAYDSLYELHVFSKYDRSFHCEWFDFPKPRNVDSARMEAISFAAFRMIEARFVNAPKYVFIMAEIRKIMLRMGYDFSFLDTDYTTGKPAALGNAVAKCILAYGLDDGSNEANNYATRTYKPVNGPLYFDSLIPIQMEDPNRWQPLFVKRAIDQNGNPIPPLQKFQSPEWGNVRPFALTDPVVFERDGQPYPVYIDPGQFPQLDTLDANNPRSREFKWNMELVIAYSAHLSPEDDVEWDISPNGMGNLPNYFPQTFEEFKAYYDFKEGRSLGFGYEKNPATGLPYKPQMVKRGDFTRLLAQYWADGPATETPPGHWFALYNTLVSDKLAVKKYAGKGKVLNDLEYDLLAYVTLGAAMHDAAIAAWGVKGWYDGVRPISAIRYMATLGQCTDPRLPSYHPGGLDLIEGLIELIEPGDSLALVDPSNIGKIKIRAWRGHKEIQNEATDLAGVGWILGERWLPYQEITFVTPPFAGYVSGHSTYSRAAADVLTLFTGDKYFPGGLGSYVITPFRRLIRYEKNPSYDVTLEWATYQDASNQSSLSRIWGGIHPPFDDIPGRRIGSEVAKRVFEKTRELFFDDDDGDGYYSHEDCRDDDAAIHPGAKEVTDGVDNDCDGLIDNVVGTTNIAQSVFIYPNPVSGREIHIANMPKGRYKLSLTDVLGKTFDLQSLDIFDTIHVVRFVPLPAGTYFLKLSGDRSEFLTKLFML